MPQRQLALVMVVDVAERGLTGLVRPIAQPHRAQVLAQQVPGRLGAVLLAACPHESLEGAGEIVVQRHGQALHRSPVNSCRRHSLSAKPDINLPACVAMDERKRSNSL